MTWLGSNSIELSHCFWVLELKPTEFMLSDCWIILWGISLLIISTSLPICINIRSEANLLIVYSVWGKGLLCQYYSICHNWWSCDVILVIKSLLTPGWWYMHWCCHYSCFMWPYCWIKLIPIIALLANLVHGNFYSSQPHNHQWRTYVKYKRCVLIVTRIYGCYR